MKLKLPRRKAASSPGGLGRIPSIPDERNDNFRIGLLTAAAPPEKIPMKRTFKLSWRGDQGRTNQCVGFSTFGFLKAAPARAGKVTPEGIYQGAQMYDEWPGEGYEGSSVHGVMKFLKDYTPAEDVIAYYWGKTVRECVQWMGGEKGTPVVIGINWYTGLGRPNAEGIIAPTGQIEGGHAILWLGYDEKRGLALLQNSWGKDWGKGGRAWVSFEDLDRLLREDGEAAIATKWRRVLGMAGGTLGLVDGTQSQ